MQYLKEDVRKKILSAALTEFKEHGYLEASMRNIAARAGIALGSIYRYFDNKEALFDALIYPVYSGIFIYLSKIKLEMEKSPFGANSSSCVSIPDILDAIIEMVKKSHTEIMIIFNKSKGSKYENVKTEITDLIYKINLQTFKKEVENDEGNSTIVYILSYSFIEGISLIFKQNSNGDTVKLLVHKLIYLFYKNACERLAQSE